MPIKLTFGEFFKQKRIGLKKTLRQFCAENKLDPGNISKMKSLALAGKGLGAFIDANVKDRFSRKIR
ncbi:MAG: hypothetical protein A2W53_06325 [Nitrospinae bacterium RIFCSPHIGHO2_02_39_11]|nr:MAG: hypothetical protein A2W53_06325 [Nitrospinae bacterium RIFCSPHIGHO2_02_39_11]